MVHSELVWKTLRFATLLLVRFAENRLKTVSKTLTATPMAQEQRCADTRNSWRQARSVFSRLTAGSRFSFGFCRQPEVIYKAPSSPSMGQERFCADPGLFWL